MKDFGGFCRENGKSSGYYGASKPLLHVSKHAPGVQQGAHKLTDNCYSSQNWENLDKAARLVSLRSSLESMQQKPPAWSASRVNSLKKQSTDVRRVSGKSPAESALNAHSCQVGRNQEVRTHSSITVKGDGQVTLIAATEKGNCIYGRASAPLLCCMMDDGAGGSEPVGPLQKFVGSTARKQHTFV